MSGSLYDKLVRHKIEFLSTQRQELFVLQKYNPMSFQKNIKKASVSNFNKNQSSLAKSS